MLVRDIDSLMYKTEAENVHDNFVKINSFWF